MDEMFRVLRFVVGGFFWLFGLIFVVVLFLPSPTILDALGAVNFLVLGWLIFPLKPKLPTYDAATYEDPEVKP